MAGRSVRRTALMCCTFACLAAACSGSKFNAEKRPSGTTTVSSTRTVPLPPRAPGLLAAALRPPRGFAQSTSSDVHNGAMTAAAYDEFMNHSGAAGEDHFVDGYQRRLPSSSTHAFESGAERACFA